MQNLRVLKQEKNFIFVQHLSFNEHLKFMLNRNEHEKSFISLGPT